MTDPHDDPPPLCPGPHRGEQQRPELQPADVVCADCERALLRALRDLPDLYVRLWLAELSDDQQPAAHRGTGDYWGEEQRSIEQAATASHDPDVIMRRCREVLTCWHEAVAAAVGLSGMPAPRRPVEQQQVVRLEQVVRPSVFPSLPGEQERPETVHVEPVTRLVAVDRPYTGTEGVVITTACRVLAAHAHTLIRLPAQPVMRRRSAAELAAMPDAAIGEIIATRHGPRTTVPGWRLLPAGDAEQLLDLDGVQALGEIIDLWRQARRVLGDTTGLQTFTAPCPSCGEPGLAAWDGQDTIDCGVCGEQHPRDSYDLLRVVLVDEIRRSGTWRAVDLSRVALPAARAAELARVKPATLRSWVNRGRLVAAGRDGYGRPTYRLDHVLELADESEGKTG